MNQSLLTLRSQPVPAVMEWTAGYQLTRQMVALQARDQERNRGGSRPINLKTDMPQIAKLLGLVFKQQIRAREAYALGVNMRLASLSWPLRGGSGVVPGFVWEEDGHIVGNVSLLTTSNAANFLVANVAVHPDYRRQGIARALMQDLLDYTAERGGRKILLQVEAQNTGAIDLYHRLGFVTVDTTHSWQGHYGQLGQIALPVTSYGPDRFEGFTIRPLRGSDWRTAYDIDQTAFTSDLNWPEPIQKDHYKRGFSSWWNNFMSGRQEEVWVAADAVDDPIGFGVIESEWARAHNLKLRILPDWHSQAARPLLAKLFRRLRYLRRRPIQIEHLASDYLMNEMLQQSGLHLRRTLTTMRYDHR